MGEICALASALCFAVSNVTIMRGGRRSAEDNGAFLSLLLTAGISGALWLAISLVRGFAPVTLRGLLWLAAAGVFTAFIGRVFLYVSIRHLGAMRAAAVKRLNPLFAVLLGVVVLGEVITGPTAWGMALIVASFLVLVQAQLRRRAAGATEAGSDHRLARLGYLYGVASALGYALGNLLRKDGLSDSPDPFFGAMIGTLVGAALYLGMAGVKPSYRAAVRQTFGRPNPWLYAAGVMASFGQILAFAALGLSPMSRVALIGSMEVFFTIAFSLLFFGERLTPGLAVAALLGFLGTAVLVGA